jgi:hypothetical protein
VKCNSKAPIICLETSKALGWLVRLRRRDTRLGMDDGDVRVVVLEGGLGGRRLLETFA